VTRASLAERNSFSVAERVDDVIIVTLLEVDVGRWGFARLFPLTHAAT